MSEIRIEKLVFGGQALAHSEDKTWFVWNALPGELVECTVLKKRKGIVEAVATKIISASPDRTPLPEPHALCCSPWSIMTRDAERTAKIAVADETFKKLSGGAVVLPPRDFVDSPQGHGYRNKIEFSFTYGADNKPALAFFNRGTHSLVALENCALAHPHINELAVIILDWAKKNNWTVRNLKSVIIRTNNDGQTIAGLFIKDELAMPPLPALPAWCIGFRVYYSTHRSPASTPDKLLAEYGTTELEEKIGSAVLRYGLFSFFQINVPVFEQALGDIASFVPKKASLVDYYSGVGTIGLALAKNAGHVTLVESNLEAGEYAQKNILANGYKNVEAVTAPAEHMLDYISKDKIVILDPPRMGLDKRVVERLLAASPEQIIYLSCGPDTQARDLGLLAAGYKPVFARLYNFFPRTPHLESLVVLDRSV